MLAKRRGWWAALQKHTMILCLHSTDTLIVMWTTGSLPSVSVLIIIVRGLDCSTLSQTLIFHSVLNLVYVVLGM